MDTLIIGRGYLGEKLKHSVEFGKAMVNPSTQRINSKKDVISLIDRFKPEVIINAAGVTGHPNVDWCETHRAETYQGNVVLPVNIATACAEKGVKMVHFGSGCIYEGDNDGKGYDELDLPNFKGSVYSRSKIECERILNDMANDPSQNLDLLELRIRMPLDGNPSRKNLLTKLLKYASEGKPIVNAPNSITSVNDIPAAVSRLIEYGAKGVYNLVNPGTLTHEHLINIYKKVSGKEFDVNYVSAKEFDNVGNTAARRSNCVLSTYKLERLVDLDDAYTAATKCITEYVKNESAPVGAH